MKCSVVSQQPLDTGYTAPKGRVGIIIDHTTILHYCTLDIYTLGLQFTMLALEGNQYISLVCASDPNVTTDKQDYQVNLIVCQPIINSEEITILAQLTASRCFFSNNFQHVYIQHVLHFLLLFSLSIFSPSLVTTTHH